MRQLRLAMALASLTALPLNQGCGDRQTSAPPTSSPKVEESESKNAAIKFVNIPDNYSVKAKTLFPVVATFSSPEMADGESLVAAFELRQGKVIVAQKTTTLNGIKKDPQGLVTLEAELSAPSSPGKYQLFATVHRLTPGRITKYEFKESRPVEVMP